MKSVKVYKVAGQEFVLVGPMSLLHDAAAMRLLGDLGLLDTGPPSGAAPEVVEQWVRSTTAKLNAAGRLHEVLGYVVARKGTDPSEWTEDVGHEVSDFLARQADPKDRATVEALLAEAMAHFFALALSSWGSSLTSSVTAGKAPHAAQNRATRDRGASGLRFSGDYPVATTNTQPARPAGPSASPSPPTS